MAFEYQKYLDKLGILSEEKFNEVIKEFPNIEIDEIDLFEDEITVDQLAMAFLDTLVEKYPYCEVSEVNFDEKTFRLEEVQTLEDLEAIQNELPNWTIDDYDQIKEEILEDERQEQADRETAEKIKIFDSVNLDLIPLKDLEEFINKYVNKK